MTRSLRIAFLALAILPSPLAIAEDVTPAPAVVAPALRRAQVVASSQLGESFLSNNRESYQVVVGLRAISRGEATADARMAGLAMSPADIVEEKGRILIVRRVPSTGTPAARVRDAGAIGTTDGAMDNPVVVNVRTGQFGFMTGNVVAKLRDPGEAAAIAKASGLGLDYVAPAIGYAFFRVPAGRDVVSAAEALRADPGVESARPEVIEASKEKR